jgi:signal transduction histidine kinase
VNLDSDIPSINADRSQMEQVFLNIFKDSKEVVPVNGHLKITTQMNPVAVTFEDDGPGL